jgi:hypothetical protein
MFFVPLPGTDGDDARRQLLLGLIPLPTNVAPVAVTIETVSTDYLRAFLGDPTSIAAAATFTPTASSSTDLLAYIRSHLNDPN